MPTYKLVYFDEQGIAEIPRMLLLLAGVEFEDVRLSPEQFLELKPSFKFKKVPVLYVDGHAIAQSMAISRYLAKKLGFVGKTDFDEARADMIADYTLDLNRETFLMYWARKKDQQERERVRQSFMEKLPIFLSNLEENLMENNGGNGYFVGDALTWADVAFCHHVDWPSFMGVDVDLSPYPKLNNLYKRVTQIPAIANWRQTRPVTPF